MMFRQFENGGPLTDDRYEILGLSSLDMAPIKGLAREVHKTESVITVVKYRRHRQSVDRPALDTPTYPH